ncbi:LysR family transcriptional regulator [Methylocystis sp. SC2]|uniref:LysR family transcriptional regulator n=1 Tax=Methylocystis sp. (strain SC2) TaxID=187303 RepID=UPI001FCC97D0|nr:LysR family transcriptional regulator [Methylocystis sp. SC2]
MRSFVAVAEELHFGRAAVRLGISQPPLSKHVQQLEDALGVTLLNRTHRNVTLTAAGRVFLDEARRTLAQSFLAIDLARRADRGTSGQLAFGFIDASIYSVVPAVVRRFHQLYPSVHLSLREMLIPDQVTGLAERRIDAGLIHPPMVRTDIAIEPIFTEPLAVALPKNHPLAERPALKVADLADEPFVQFPRFINPTLYDDILALCRGAGFSPMIVQEATPKQTIIGLVEAGLGVSLLPASLRFLARIGVVYAPLEDSSLAIETSLIWRSGDDAPALKRFIEVVREVSTRLS